MDGFQREQHNPCDQAALHSHQNTVFRPLLSKGKCLFLPHLFPVFAGGYNIVTSVSAIDLFEWCKASNLSPD